MKKNLRFSLIIPLAPWRDAEILSSISKLDYPKNKFEIIIEKGLNVPDNRNNGVKKAKGEIIIFLDDDGQIEKDFLSKMDKIFTKNPEIDILGGPQLTPKTDKFFAKTSGYALASMFGVYTASNRYNSSKFTLNADENFITGANMTCRKKVFKNLSFDHNVYPSDDLNFVRIAKQKGFVVAYSPDVVIYHRRRANFSGLVKQIFDYGRARLKKDALSQIVRTPLILVPSALLIYLLILPTLTIISNLFFLPLYAYLLLSILFSIYESAKNKDLLVFPVVVFIYLTIHLSYGAGFILGFIDKVFKSSKTHS